MSKFEYRNKFKIINPNDQNSFEFLTFVFFIVKQKLQLICFVFRASYFEF